MGYREQRLEEVKKYYQGFSYNKIKRGCMYQDELNDLEEVYRNSLDKMQEKVEEVLPSLLYYMQEFLELHRENEKVRDKLDVLMAKKESICQRQDHE